MSDETIFYIVGCVLAASAVVVTFAGLKLKNFPGKALPVVILWFVILAGGAATYSVLLAQEHEEAHAAEHETEHAEEAESGPYENEGGALGGERDELEEEAEEEAEGSPGEEPVGPTEQEKGDEGAAEGQEGTEGATGANSGGEASETTLKLAADPSALLFDKEELSAKAGKVTIDFDNPSAIPHNVVIEEGEKELAGFEPISESEESLSADLEAGSYEYVCTVPGHEEAGMKGTLTVE